MNKFKIRESYLLLLIVLGLVSLGIYTTYALFTASTTINDVVGITATLDIGKSMSEYEVITIQSEETKLIELNVVNSYNDNVYYGAWYKIVQGNSDDIQIGLYTEKNPNPSSGVLTASSNIKLLAGITNDNTTPIVVYIGVKGSLTNELNLGSDKTLLPNDFSEALLVTDEVLESKKVITEQAVNNSYEATGEVQNVTLNPGTYKLEVWGAQGGSYNDTYAGGKGGYSYGTLTLTDETNLFIYVGKQGTGTGTSTTGLVSGGFNGGGNGYSSSTSYLSSAGGGASDIRIGEDSLYSRVIVAGGGGGAGSYSNSSTRHYSGGVGGGESGTAGGQYSTSYKAGLGGSQTAAGTSYYGTTANSTTSSYGTVASFGIGASGKSSSGVAGGGGGWYGGGYGRRAAGGGGSGYVYTSSTSSNYPTGNLLTSTYYLTDAATLAGNTSFTDFDGTTVTGHAGDGNAKITGTSKIVSYTIPRLTGLTDLVVKIGTNVSLTDGITLICENNTTTGCLITKISITDTSSLTEGTYIVTYTVKGMNNKKYLFNRNVNITANLDISGANIPDLVDGLIPVMYDGSKWVKADSKNRNSTYQWYDYDNKLWANAVLVTETNRSTYQSASAGTTITESDILAFYVWIPRYKYKVWNKDKVIGTASYDAYNTGIDIVFENEKSTTGVINCNYDFTVSDDDALSEVCTGSNGDYYTHPAFTFGSDELRGIWIGKFEVSSSDPTADYGGDNTTNLTVRILPNVISWRPNNISNFFTVIQNMQISDNIYGLNTSKTIIDSHMLTNMEWGAVAYLTNSKYGRCTNESCAEVTINNCSSYITGIGADTSTASGSSTTCTTGDNKYNGTIGVLASTTGNITGIYDMSGGAYEYVMGNMSISLNSYTMSLGSTGFASDWYTAATAKYVITYAEFQTGSYQTGQKSWNRTRLGDAMGEIILNSDSNSNAWYSEYLEYLSSGNPWVRRGGVYNNGSNSNYKSGLFFAAGINAGTANYNYSTHTALVSLK